MKAKKCGFVTGCVMAVGALACSAGTTERPAAEAQAPGVVDMSPPPPMTEAPEGTGKLAATFKEHFGVGVAVEPRHLTSVGPILSGDFNRLTAENAMKFAQLHPSEGSYAFERADEIAEFARQHSMAMTGHALVWYRETPAWLVAANDPSATTAALDEHIRTVVERYADVTDNWDVVNEAISDSGGKTYRDGDEGSKLYPLYGGQQYIKVAFESAAAAVSATGKSIALYYNDYNVVDDAKRAKIIEMVRWLKAEGVQIDGVGLQAHWNIEWPNDALLQKTIDELVAEGVKLKISELDLSVYTKDDYGTETWEPQKEFTADLAQRQAQRYQQLFALFAKNAEHITSVTFWGVSDDQTWLDDFPAAGRNNYPLLFDDQHQPKPAYFSILQAL